MWYWITITSLIEIKLIERISMENIDKEKRKRKVLYMNIFFLHFRFRYFSSILYEEKNRLRGILLMV